MFSLTLKFRKVLIRDLSTKALAYHNAQLEASAFREEISSFEDLTEPKYEMIHKVRAFALVLDCRTEADVFLARWQAHQCLEECFG